MLVFDVKDGSLKAVVDAARITAVRTAAVSAVTTRQLARPDATELALLGSGAQAKTHLEALLHVRKFSQITVWSPHSQNACQFRDDMSNKHQVPIEVCDTAEEAVASADIICTLTSSKTPILDGDWVKPGAHINAVGACKSDDRELASNLVQQAKFYVDSVESPEEPFADTGEREPENLHKYELRNDILVYTSDVLTETVTVAGELSATIYASSTGFDTDWVVTLTDVYPSGDSVRLSNYIVRAKYRHGYDYPELLQPGKVEEYQIFLQNIAHTFKEGHRVRVTITSSSKFVAFPNLNTGTNPYQHDEPQIVTQQVFHGPQYPSHIKLPLLRK